MASLLATGSGQNVAAKLPVLCLLTPDIQAAANLWLLSCQVAFSRMALKVWSAGC
eukprot:CAMPEP_0115139254 /NCGR_PEP_ID=MMETSP0227-20121206/58172_1 /TAXON_ID=89957 /ORGANISM="Polarella glacialis, Strain CCMP 1383" /LENGTH=54 /DNA_ID=CAMNT_0002547069 /DNA_START=9 /DNA_END=173 /DNA_ORIENTATION=+